MLIENISNNLAISAPLLPESDVFIPIVNGAFTYKFKYKDTEAYSLVFEDEFQHGSMRINTFFPINGTITMELFPEEEYEKNSIKGGKENKESIEFESISKQIKPIEDSLEALQRDGKYLNHIAQDMLDKMNNADNDEDRGIIYQQLQASVQSGEGLSTEAKIITAQRDSMLKMINNKEVEFIRENISIPSYYRLILAIQKAKLFPEYYNFDELKTLQEKYASTFKNHPYTNYSNKVIWSFTNMKPGGNYYDVTLPDLQGKEYKISEEIKGKYAFIDIWAPWCGPCIEKSRTMKPVFETYKNKDFTVIGIASKYRKISDVEKLLEKDNYPWITLIDKPELDSQLNDYYGIKNAGGITILLDKTGKIVLVNPSVEEVIKFLESNL